MRDTFTILTAAVTVAGALLVPAAAAADAVEDLPGSRDVLTAGQVPAGAVGDEVALADLANGERTGRGLAALRTDLRLVRVARVHSAAMAADDDRGGECGDGRTLRHQGDLAGGISGTWVNLDENVICAGGPEAAHRLLMGSQPHRRNLLAAGTDAFGIGAARARDGTLWVTQIFMGGGTTPSARPVRAGIRAAGATFAPGEADHVVLSRSDVFADSLAGAALAAGGGPVLFTDAPRRAEPDPILHPRTRVEVDRLLGGRGTVYLLGGPRAVSRRVEQELAGAGYTPVRLAGPTRIETSVAIAREVVRRSGVPPRLQIAAAYAWPDAVTSGAAAGRTGALLVLTEPDRLSAATADFVALYPDAARVVLGGPAAVSDSVVARLGASRVAGPSRVETALGVIDRLFGSIGGEVVVVDGYDALGWAEALAWSAYASRRGAPEVLVGDTVPASVAAWLQGAEAVDRAVFTGSVSPEVRAQVEDLIRR